MFDLTNVYLRIYGAEQVFALFCLVFVKCRGDSILRVKTVKNECKRIILRFIRNFDEKYLAFCRD